MQQLYSAILTRIARMLAG